MTKLGSAADPLENVSRETLDALFEYEKLVVKWNQKINLVAPNTIREFRTRHITDSAQAFTCASNTSGLWLDIGSGAGLPGLVIAILAKQHAPELSIELVESDQRKSTFLRTVIRELDLTARVSTSRIEKTEPRSAKTLSSRALAPLPKLLEYVHLHLDTEGEAILHKGKNWQHELKDAQECWQFDVEAHKSVLDEQSVILKIRNVRHG